VRGRETLTFTVLSLAIVLAIAVSAAAGVRAGHPRPRPAAPQAYAAAVHDRPTWQSYLEQPANSDVTPVSAAVLLGSVSGARALTGHGGGDTTLTMLPGGAPATVLLDYGIEVEGSPYVTVESYAGDGPAPALSLAFSESMAYLRVPGSSVLAAPAAAGDTTVTVQSRSRHGRLTFAVGDTVTVGSPAETDTITAISGAALTLKVPLADSHPAGAAVRSRPGAVTGDSALHAPRRVSVRVTSASTLAGGLMGGFRFEAITLTQPGTVVLSGAGVRFGDGYLATAADYQGYFESSSTAFNTMYYDGAYTEQTDMQPAGVNGATEPSVIEGQGIADTLGANGEDYVKQSLLALITSSPRGGGLNAVTRCRARPHGNPRCHSEPYSNSYSSWTLDAATEYYRDTGDKAFAEQVLPWLVGQLSYDASLAGRHGLIVTSPQDSAASGGYDWDFYDGAKTGQVTAFNELYYRALRDVAYIEASLGNPARAARYNRTAGHVRNAINAYLLNRATGTYYLSRSDHSTLAQDANALAVAFGIAPKADVPKIVSSLKTLWGPHGSKTYSGAAYNPLISPFITAFEVEADYLAGDNADAEQLLNLTWDQMIDPHNPFYTGTMWENLGPSGTPTKARTSLAHGWSSGPTPIMISYVLGVQPLAPGYQTFTVAPHPGSLQWAQGAIPTPYGRILVRWQADGRRLSLTVTVPPQATAFISLPGGSPATLAGGHSGAKRTFTADAQANDQPRAND